MDWKSRLDDLKSQTDGVLKQAEAKCMGGPRPGPGGTSGKTA